MNNAVKRYASPLEQKSVVRHQRYVLLPVLLITLNIDIAVIVLFLI